MNNLSERLRMTRKAHGYSQTSLAQIVGVTQTTISDMEAGKRRPSVEVLEKLCDALECSSDYLLGLLPTGEGSTLGQSRLPGALTPEILAMVEERNISESELKTALKLTSVMREDKGK